MAELCHYLGHETNNVAEYNGLLAALRYSIEHGKKALKVISDSELLVRQMKGIYKVKNHEPERGRAARLSGALQVHSGPRVSGHEKSAQYLWLKLLAQTASAGSPRAGLPSSLVGEGGEF